MIRPISILTDCADSDGAFRLDGRIGALTGELPSIGMLPAHNPAIAAGLTLANALKAATIALGQHQRSCIKVVNAAPRDGHYPNGVPFGFFTYTGDPACELCPPHLVITTAGVETLIPLRHMLGITHINVVDVETVMKVAAEASWGFGLTDEDVLMIAEDQFRSLWFETVLAVWLDRGHEFPSERWEIPQASVPYMVRVIDRFGNCKCMETPEELGCELGQRFRVGRIGSIRPLRTVEYYQRLVDVPYGRPGLVRGSSGTLELVIRMGHADKKFGLSTGSVLDIRAA